MGLVIGLLVIGGWWWGYQASNRSAIPSLRIGSTNTASVVLEILESAQVGVDRVKQSDQRASLLARIAFLQAHIGHREKAEQTFAEAIQIAQKVEELRSRSDVLVQIAIAQVKAGYKEQGLHTLEQAVLSRKQARDDVRVTGGELRWIAHTLARLQLYEPAMQTAQQIVLDDLRAITIEDITVEKISQMVQEGQIEQGLRLALEIQSPFARRVALLHAVSALAESGKIDQALQVASTIPEDGYRATALAEIAKAQAKAGVEKAAQRTFEQAIQLAQKIHFEGIRYTSFGSIAIAQSEAGYIEQALRTLEQIKRDSARAFCSVEVMERLIQKGHKEPAEQVLQQVIQLSARLSDPPTRLDLLKRVAMLQASAGYGEQALQTAQEIEQKLGIESYALVLAEIAIAQAQIGQIDQALQNAEQVAELHRQILRDASKRQSASQRFFDTIRGRRRAPVMIFDPFRGKHYEITPFGREDVWRAIAKAQARAGQVEQAISTAERVFNDPYAYKNALLDIAETLLKVSLAP